MCVANQLCDAGGSLSPYEDPVTGQCKCKVLLKFLKIIAFLYATNNK